MSLGNFLFLVPMVFFMAVHIGMLLPAVQKVREAAARSSSTNNLKMIGLGFQSHNDAMNCLPYNGGSTDPGELENLNFGWHSPNVVNSGTWATQILPFIEQNPLFNAVRPKATGIDEAKYFTVAANNADWQMTIKTYNCPGRGRAGFKTDGTYRGIVTDYAINVFVNSSPTKYNAFGFGEDGGIAIAKQSRATIQGISDGSSNTILVGGKALPTNEQSTNKGEGWDCGIFSPGDYTVTKEKYEVKGTGTGRGHIVDAKPPVKDSKERVAGVPWMWRDEELAKKPVPDYAMDWGGPFNGGVLYMFGDGTVRTVNYKARGSVNFARMLYPSDGMVVQFD